MELIINNLASISVLVFVVGFIAARLKSDIRIPEPVYQVISVFLLFGIGLKGGLAMREADLQSAWLPVLVTLALGTIIPVCAFYVLRFSKNLSEIDRGSIAAHYGSTSLVTFTAAIVFLESSKIYFEPYAAALLTIMEIPGLIVGIYLGSRHLATDLHWAESLKEIVLGKTILLLSAGLIAGGISGQAGFDKVAPFFVDLQPGILALFLIHLGYVAGSQASELKKAGLALAGFGIAFPVFSGTLGVALGAWSGLSVGGALVLGVLAASASYIAAPAAVGISLPTANLSLSITTALAITFPFNLIFGIPLYLWIAELLVAV